MWLHVPQEALSASAPESEGLTSGSQPHVEWSLWCTSSGKPSRQPSSWPGWLTRDWHKLLSGTTCAPSTLARGADWWISLLAERRARTSVSPGSALGWMARGANSSSSTSGSPSSARPRSSFGRTSPEQLGLFPASVSTSKSEATAVRGPSFERVTLTPHTSEPASSFWPTPKSSNADKSGSARDTNSRGNPAITAASILWIKGLWPTARASDGSKGEPDQWPTPTAQSYGTNQGGAAGRTGPVRPNLDTLARQQWPTPTVNGNYNRAGLSPTSGDGLSTAATNWPTPSARDWKSGQASEPTHDRNSRPLNEMACHLGPLLLTTEEDGPESSPPPLGSLHLNPLFVEWLMGWPLGWTDFVPAATESYPLRPPTHGVDSGITSSPDSPGRVGAETTH